MKNATPWLHMMRKGLREMMAPLSEFERETFERCFPEGIDNLSEQKLKSAIALVQRTLDANAAKPAPSPVSP